MKQTYIDFLAQGICAQTQFFSNWICERIDQFNYDRERNKGICLFEVTNIQQKYLEVGSTWVFSISMIYSLDKSDLRTTLNFSIEVDQAYFDFNPISGHKYSDSIHDMVKTLVGGTPVPNKDMRKLVTQIMSAYIMHIQRIRHQQANFEARELCMGGNLEVDPPALFNYRSTFY